MLTMMESRVNLGLGDKLYFFLPVLHPALMLHFLHEQPCLSRYQMQGGSGA